MKQASAAIVFRKFRTIARLPIVLFKPPLKIIKTLKSINVVESSLSHVIVGDLI